MADFSCSYPGCDRHPRKGDSIVRVSPKGQKFVGRCTEHLAPATPEQVESFRAGERVKDWLEGKDDPGIHVAGQDPGGEDES